MKKLNQQGANLVELAIAVLILGTMASSVMMARSFMAKQTVSTTDKAYASQKAVQMFEELKSLVNGSEQVGVAVLDQYNDGSGYNTVLTTDKSVDLPAPGVKNPANPLSGNKLSNGNWRYLRQVQINRVANSPYSRQVIVNVWRYLSDQNPTQPGVLLSTVGGYLRTINSVFPPSQVLDVYCLALSNEIGWFTSIPQMLPAFQGIALDFQTRNPGLALRVHYITQPGFGRDPFYKPSINVATDTTQAAALPWAYFYPGLAYNDSSVTQLFFDNSEMVSIGNMIVDGVINNSPATNSMCDMNNPDVRYPEAVSWYAAVTQEAFAAAAAQGAQPPLPQNLPQITLRMLLEQLNSTNNFTNAVIVSMHGEVLPIVNMRNYADAAKDPIYYTNERVVTHPENLHYKTGSTVNLRVYAYIDGLGNPSTIATPFPNSSSQAGTISVWLPGCQIPKTSLTVTAVDGGIFTVAGLPVSTGYTLQTIGPGTASTSGMSWTANNGASGTTILLYNTPLRCPELTHAGSGQYTGLPAANWLYGCEYIPCPVDLNTSFTTNLTTATDAIPKNTARWIITLPNGSNEITDGQFAIETRIGNDMSTGTALNAHGVTEMSNLSRTFVWVGTGSNSSVNWGGSGVVPFTEQFQYNGDPRDCPYLDCKFGSANLPTPENDSFTNIPANSYNWYFKDIHTNPTDGFQGFSKATTGYLNYQDCRDIPRFFYTYRRGLLNNTAIFTNINGQVAYHASEGGEIGSVWAPFSNSITFNMKPWYPAAAAASINTQDEIQATNNWTAPGASAGTNGIARYVMKYNGASTNPDTNWYERPWMGELYPDAAFVNAGAGYGGGWVTQGNLPTGTTGFWRVPLSALISSGGTTNGFVSGRDYQWGINNRGAAAFFNGRTSSGVSCGFIHTTGESDTQALTVIGNDEYPITNYPLISPIVGDGSVTTKFHPWCFNYDLHNTNIGNVCPDEWLDSYYGSVSIRTTLSIPTVTSTEDGTNIPRYFYDENATTAGCTMGSTWIAEGVIQMSVTSPTTETAFFNISGMAQQGGFDTSGLAETCLTTSIRTFLDGGNYSGVAHITQLPLVEVYVNSANDQYSQPSSIGITLTSPVTNTNGPVSNVWYRYAGITNPTGNFYTEEYPGYVVAGPVTNVLSNSTYSEMSTVGGSQPMSLIVNFKYSANAGVTWGFMSDSSAATIGVLDTTRAITASSSMPITYSWSVPASSFPQGDYLIMGEAWRQTSTGAPFPLHYSYHQLDVTINR